MQNFRYKELDNSLYALDSSNVLLFDFTTRYRLSGNSKMPALIQTGKVQICLILMANTTTIAGFLLLTLKLETCSEILQPFAVVIISELVNSMFFLLIVIQVLYDLFEK